MRRTLIIILSLLFMFGVAAATYALYSNHDEILDYEEVVSKERYMDSEGNFHGKFLCELKGKVISEYDYSVDGDKLYITLYATAGRGGGLPAGEDGYFVMDIHVGTGIDKIYYLCRGEESAMTFDRR